MPVTAYAPQDTERYRRRENSVLFSPDLEAGDYVYVQGCNGEIRVLPDGCHVHPYVLGGALPAMVAGELTVDENGHVVRLNNMFGTFQCRPTACLQQLVA